MGTYRLTTPAAADYVNILVFTLERWGLEQYDRYSTLLDSAFMKLVSLPKLGKHKSYIPSDARLYRVGSHQVVYRRIGQDIEILRILHIRQQINISLFQ
jgi:toxin ParE1/3/4